MSLRTTLSNIIIGKRCTCSLCLQNVDEATQVTFEDEIAVPDFHGTHKFYDILLFVLGDEITHTKSLEDCICLPCQKSLLQSYKFIKMCKENSNNIHKTLNSLSNVFDNIDYKNIECKSIFIALNTAEVPTKVYCDYKNLPISKNYQNGLFKRFQNLIKESGFKNESDYHSDFFDDSNDNSVFKKSEYVVIKNLKKSRKERKETKSERRKINIEDIACDDELKKCKYCLKTLTDTRHLRFHYLRCHAPKEIQCSKCPKAFSGHTFLKEHIENCHAPVICCQCGKKFTNKKYLKIHENTHKIRSICQKCGKSYKTISTFRKHICQVTKEKLEKVFPCELCDKKFGRLSSVQKHVNFIHKGKGYICSWCGKKWSSPAALNAHTITHTQEKKFSCDICGGKFVSKASLLYHTRIHTGEKPYKCNNCDKYFLSASRRMDHMRHKHIEAMLACDICGKKLRTKTCLRQHISRHSNPKSKLYNSENELLKKDGSNPIAML